MSIKQNLLKQIDNFIDDFSKIFPDKVEIQLFVQKYNLIRNVNSTLIIDYFIKYIYPNKTQIMNNDENFFITGGGQEELKDNNGLKLRDTIKKLWVSETSNENKEIIWKYFKIFILLSEKYIIENIDKK